MARNKKRNGGSKSAPNVADTAPLATWRVHLLADSGLRGVVATALTALAVATALLVSGGGIFSLLLAAAFLWSLSDFFLPYQYTLTGNEVVVRTPISERRVPWRRLHGYSASQGGILLTPLKRRSVLDRFRGMFLHVTPEDRERVLELVRGLVRRGSVSR